MVEVSKEERIENFIEIYYRATAEVFEFSYGTGKTSEYMEQRTKESLEALQKIGIDVKINPETVSRFVAVQKKLEEIGSNTTLDEKVAGLEGIDFLGKQEVTRYARMVAMTESNGKNGSGFTRNSVSC